MQVISGLVHRLSVLRFFLFVVLITILVVVVVGTILATIQMISVYCMKSNNIIGMIAHTLPTMRACMVDSMTQNFLSVLF